MKIIIIIVLFIILMSGCSALQKETPSQEDPTEVVSSGESLSELTVSPANIQPDWHYYIKSDGIFRTSTREVIKINDSHSASGIIITDEWVYYKENGLLFRIDNENRKELVYSEVCWQWQLSGDKLYFKNNSGINRMNLDGSGKELILQCEFVNMVVTDKYIFYVIDVPYYDEDHHEDGPPLPTGELHRVDLNGENDVNLCTMVYSLEAYNNTVYFSDSSNDVFYSMNPETLVREAVYTDSWVSTPYFNSEYVFFISNHHGFYRLCLTDGTVTQLTEAWGIRCLGILDGYVYIEIYGVDPNEAGLYRIKIDGIDLEKVE